MKVIKVISIFCVASFSGNCQYMDVSFCHDWYGAGAPIEDYSYVTRKKVSLWEEFLQYVDLSTVKVLPHDSLLRRLEKFHEKYPCYEIPSEGKWERYCKALKRYESYGDKSYLFYIKDLNYVLNVRYLHKNNSFSNRLYLQSVVKNDIPRQFIIRKDYDIEPPCGFNRCDLEDTEQEMAKWVFEKEILRKLLDGLEYVEQSELMKRENLDRYFRKKK